LAASHAFALVSFPTSPASSVDQFSASHRVFQECMTAASWRFDCEGPYLVGFRREVVDQKVLECVEGFSSRSSHSYRGGRFDSITPAVLIRQLGVLVWPVGRQKACSTEIEEMLGTGGAVAPESLSSFSYRDGGTLPFALYYERRNPIADRLGSLRWHSGTESGRESCSRCRGRVPGHQQGIHQRFSGLRCLPPQNCDCRISLFHAEVARQRSPGWVTDPATGPERYKSLG
jgi:hypothetical protein